MENIDYEVKSALAPILILTALMLFMWLLGVLFPDPAAPRVVYVQKNLEPFEGGRPERCVYFAMSGCPHCVRFDPVWEEVASSAPGVKMVRYDVSDSDGRAEAEKAGVRAFPHVMKSYSDGSSKTFEGARTAEALKYFCAN